MLVGVSPIWCQCAGSVFVWILIEVIPFRKGPYLVTADNKINVSVRSWKRYPHHKGAFSTVFIIIHACFSSHMHVPVAKIKCKHIDLVVCTPWHTFKAHVWFLFQIQLLFRELLTAAFELVSTCSCLSVAGCPNCIQVSHDFLHRNILHLVMRKLTPQNCFAGTVM